DAYSITSSARCCKNHGTSSPSAFAVFRLMTSSNLVDCSTGRSAGSAPLRILSTKTARQAKLSRNFGSLTAAALRAGASADSGILSRHQKFFCKNVFRQKGYPLLGGRNIFGQFFGRGGISNSQNSKVPLPGGRICRTHIQARLRCAKPCQFRPAV